MNKKFLCRRVTDGTHTDLDPIHLVIFCGHTQTQTPSGKYYSHRSFFYTSASVSSYGHPQTMNGGGISSWFYCSTVSINLIQYILSCDLSCSSLFLVDSVPSSPLVPSDESVLVDPRTSPRSRTHFPFSLWGSPGVMIVPEDVRIGILSRSWEILVR